MNQGPTARITPLSSTPTYSLSQLVMLHWDWSNFGLPKICRELVNTDNISPFLLTMSIGSTIKADIQEVFLFRCQHVFSLNQLALYLSRKEKFSRPHFPLFPWKSNTFLAHNISEIFHKFPTRFHFNNFLNSYRFTYHAAYEIFWPLVSLYRITVTLKIDISSYECQWINLCKPCVVS